MDAWTGLVFRYLRHSQPYESPSAPPPIDRQTAETIARARVGGTAPLSIERSELRIGFTAGGEQRLIWGVVVSGPTGPDSRVRAYWWVEVDAETGLAEITAQG